MRKIGYNEFVNKAIPQLAAKKYPGVELETAQQQLIDLLCAKGAPVTNAVVFFIFLLYRKQIVVVF